MLQQKESAPSRGKQARIHVNKTHLILSRTVRECIVIVAAIIACYGIILVLAAVLQSGALSCLL